MGPKKKSERRERKRSALVGLGRYEENARFPHNHCGVTTEAYNLWWWKMKAGRIMRKTCVFLIIVVAVGKGYTTCSGFRKMMEKPALG